MLHVFALLPGQVRGNLNKQLKLMLARKGSVHSWLIDFKHRNGKTLHFDFVLWVICNEGRDLFKDGP